MLFMLKDASISISGSLSFSALRCNLVDKDWTCTCLWETWLREWICGLHWNWIDFVARVLSSPECGLLILLVTAGVTVNNFGLTLIFQSIITKGIRRDNMAILFKIFCCILSNLIVSKKWFANLKRNWKRKLVVRITFFQIIFKSMWDHTIQSSFVI